MQELVFCKKYSPIKLCRQALANSLVATKPNAILLNALTTTEAFDFVIYDNSKSC